MSGEDSSVSSPPEGRRRFRLLPSRLVPSHQAMGRLRSEDAIATVTTLTMLGSFVVGLSDLLSSIVGSQEPYLLLPLAIGVAVAGFLYWRLARPLSFQARDWLIILLPPVMAARFAPYLFRGFDSLLADLSLWWASPLEFIDTLFIVYSLILIMVFRVTLDCAQDLNGLLVQPGELIDGTKPLAVMDSRADHYFDHLTPLQRIVSRFLWGGGILVLCSALATVDAAQLLTMEGARELLTFARPPVSASFGSVIVYFLAGLILMVRVQFMRRRTIWMVEDVSFDDSIGRRWLGFGAALLLIVATLALVLPIYYSLSIHEAAAVLMAVVQGITFILVSILFLALTLLLWPLTRLLGGTEADGPSLRRPEPLAEAADKADGSFLDVLGPLLFWLVLVALVAYVALAIWRRRATIAAAMPDLRSWRAVWRFLLAMSRWLWRTGRALGENIGAGLVSLVGRSIALPNPLRLSHRPFRAMGPRELIQYFYASMVEHAARAGYPRRLDETPSEYASSLRASVPELEPELGELTESFLWARYSHHTPVDEHSSWARRCWQAIRLRLKSRSRRRLKPL